VRAGIGSFGLVFTLKVAPNRFSSSLSKPRTLEHTSFLKIVSRFITRFLSVTPFKIKGGFAALVATATNGARAQHTGYPAIRRISSIWRSGDPRPPLCQLPPWLVANCVLARKSASLFFCRNKGLLKEARAREDY